MLLRKKLIDDIRDGLAAFQNYVSPSGKLNLTDVNVHAEHFVSNLLNSLYDFNLQSTNKGSATSPCIDLIDERLGLGVQVTSERTSRKVNKTLRCLNDNGYAARLRHLKIFCLVPRQKRYDVSHECEGIEFNWREDVLDFEIVVQRLSESDDMEVLKRVHEHVVSSLPDIFPDFRECVPTLNLPSTKPSVSNLAFSSRATQLVGREAELKRLVEFLGSPRQFSWWLMTGGAGSGKSRLALELCHAVSNEWSVGFLGREEAGFNWNQFIPRKKTLIVVDYVSARAEEVSHAILALSRIAGEFGHSVRMLLLERDCGNWTSILNRDESLSEAAEIADCRYDDALTLPLLNRDACLQLAGEVVRSRNGIWDKKLAEEFYWRLERCDSLCRPLFAIILADCPEAVGQIASLAELLRIVLRKESERRRRLIGDAEKIKRMNNLLLLATLTDGLILNGELIDELARSDIAGLLPDFSMLDDDTYSDLAASASRQDFLPGLQPDILGERFALDQLRSSGVSGLNARRLLAAAWRLKPEGVFVFAFRSAVDFFGDDALFTLYEVPDVTEKSRRVWAALIGETVRAIGSGTDAFIRTQIQHLLALSDKFTDDEMLQERAGLAMFNMGCHAWQNEGDVEAAAAWFDEVILRHGVDSSVGIETLLNRGLLYGFGDDIDNAFAAFTAVVESQFAISEVRAMALNNRAGIHLKAGRIDASIRDRTEVLSLQRTSPSRRFVALYERGRLYASIGSFKASLDDLSYILETQEFSHPDKLRALVMRALVSYMSGEREMAVNDLESAIQSMMSSSGDSELGLRLREVDVLRRAGRLDYASDLLFEVHEGIEGSGSRPIAILILLVLIAEGGGFNEDETKEVWVWLANGVNEAREKLRISHFIRSGGLF